MPGHYFIRILTLSLGLLLGIPGLEAATNLSPRPLRAAPGKAAPARPPVLPNAPGAKTNAAGNRVAGGKTNAVANSQSTTGKFGSSLSGLWQRLTSQGPTLPVGVGIGLFLVVLLLVRAFQSKSKKAAGGSLPVLAGGASRLPGKPARKANGTIHACNVLQFGAAKKQVWQFDARGGKYVLSREQAIANGDALPGHLVGKDWRALFQRKLNIAWLPPEHVFFRVVQLPRSDLGETLAMVELQLEKLSPMPVAQTVWSLHVLPHKDENLQTIIVMLVARSVVEEFLGQLEGQGYLADRLELPLLDQLQTTEVKRDGAWIYPEAAGGANTALVAWWYGGVLQNLDLLTLPATDRSAGLREQLTQMAWAGELEGWLTSPPEWHLVAEAAAQDWEPALREGLEQSVEVVAPPPLQQLAALTARRSALSEPAINLLPAEFATRYQQQFVDRIWMRSLLGVAALYLLGVVIYFAWLGFNTYQVTRVEDQVALFGPTYTNAIQLRDRFHVLKERQELKYAGLDCYKATARLLPEDVTLETLNFTDGKRLSLNGTAAPDQYSQMLAFDKAMRSVTNDEGQLLFDPSKGDTVQFRIQGNIANWTLNLELKRSEVQ